MKKEIRQELQKLHASAPGHLLKAEEVLKAATAKKSPLHGEFTWDNAKAGHEYRLGEARKIICSYAVFEIKTSPVTSETMRGAISLMDTRLNPGGGYLPTRDILVSSELMGSSRRDAIRELERWLIRWPFHQDLVSMIKEVLMRVRLSDQVKEVADSQ